MRLVFAGTPEFAARALEALLAAKHDIALVLTQPDRPAGRGMQAHESAVKSLALARALEVFQPESLRDAAAIARLAAARPQAMVVAAYGLLLPQSVLDLAPLGAFNIHASLLPRWRGAAPIQRALLAGDTETGITIMRMDAGLDTGPIIAVAREPIGVDDDTGTLHDRLATLGARLIVETIDALGAGRLTERPQPREGVTHAAKLAKHEARIDWRCSAEEIARQVRAMRPVPGASTAHDGVMLKIWVATPEAGGRVAAPGTVTASAADGITVACGGGSLRILTLQRAGGRRLGAGDFLCGHRLDAGAQLEGVAS